MEGAFGRTVNDIIRTAGYVSLIEGEPGAGKTTMALAACADRGASTYISYAEPEISLRKKLKNINAGPAGGIRFVNMMSGDLKMAFSEIEGALQRDELVVVDSIDAMFYAVRDDNDIRPFLQLIYGSVKNRKGSLVMISEGLNPVSAQVRFVCDAIIALKMEGLLGHRARTAIVMKDRDGEIVRPLNYFTLQGGYTVLRPLSLVTKLKLGRFTGVRLSPEAEASNEGIGGFNNILEMSMDVAGITNRLYREFLAADFLKKGYTVNFMTEPQEDESEIINDVSALLGGRAEKLNVFFRDPEALGYNAMAYFDNLTLKYPSGKSMNIVNLLYDEDFAIKEPKEYEIFSRLIAKENNRKGRLAILIGYENQEAMRIQIKYSNAFRRMTMVEGFMFWRSIRPMGPLYSVQIDAEAGSMEFIRMI